jgi:hypothetical protein
MHSKTTPVDEVTVLEARAGKEDIGPVERLPENEYTAWLKVIWPSCYGTREAALPGYAREII